MRNKDLNNNNIKLVKYTIVCIDRKRERVLHTGERIVIDPMSHAVFASWMIADYLQSEHTANEEKKYLRVNFDVLESWPQEAFTYKERQIEILEQMRDKLHHTWKFGTAIFGIGRFE